MEEWKDISGYEGLYQVSNLGNIKSLERLIQVVRVDRGWTSRKKVHWTPYPERILKASKQGTVMLVNGKVRQCVSVNNIARCHFDTFQEKEYSTDVSQPLLELFSDACNAFKVSPRALTSGIRGSDFPLMKSVFCYFVNTHHPLYTHQQIADVLRLDRSTVTLNIAKCINNISVDKKLQKYLRLLEGHFISNPLIPRSILFLKELKEIYPHKEEIINFVLEKLK